MATLLDTSALVVLLRRRPAERLAGVAEAAAQEIRAQQAVVSAVTVTELLVGARDRRAEARLHDLLERIPAVAVDRDVASLAGRLGRATRTAGAILPVADLLIAATALRLDLPVLTCDSDFARGRTLAEHAGARHPWHGFTLHWASVVG